MLKIVKKPTAPAEAESQPTEGKSLKAKVSEGVTELKAFEPMCYVEVEFGYSHKLKSEDWAKFGVKLSMPAKSADINKVFDYIKAWGDEKLNAAVEELLSAE